MPSTVATRKCAELVFVPPRFDVYREVSKQVQAIFTDYTPLVEPLSLDEAYLVPSRFMLELTGASSGDMRLSDHAARSMI